MTFYVAHNPFSSVYMPTTHNVNLKLSQVALKHTCVQNVSMDVSVFSSSSLFSESLVKA